MPRRRTNNTGSIYRTATGRFRGQLTLPSGKIKYFSGTSGADVQRKMDAYATAGNLDPAILKRTVAQAVGAWLAAVQDELKPRTLRQYRQVTRDYLVPQIGNAKLSAVTVRMAQSVNDHLRAAVSPNTAKVTRDVARNLWRWLMQQEWVHKNPWMLVRVGRVVRVAKAPYTPDEAQRLLRAAHADPQTYAIVYLCLSLGLRQGEVLALRWSDLDLVAGTLSVTGTLQWHGGGGWSIDTPKTAKSRRILPLGKPAIDALLRQADAQAVQRAVHDTHWVEHDLVFTSNRGTPLNPPTWVTRHYKPLLAMAGVPAAPFHRLRDTATSLAATAGVSDIVRRDLLGHTDTAMTNDIYTRSYVPQLAGAVQAVDALLVECDKLV